jgi:hypothetical protein
MKFTTALSIALITSLSQAAPSANELQMAQAEAKAYRAAWLELQRRDEILGISSLSNDVRDSHDQVARLSGELIRAERFGKAIVEQTVKVTEAAAAWAGDSHERTLNRRNVCGARFKRITILGLWLVVLPTHRSWLWIMNNSRSL